MSAIVALSFLVAGCVSDQGGQGSNAAGDSVMLADGTPPAHESPEGAAGDTPMDRVAREMRLRRQSAMAEFDAAISDARDALLRDRFDHARGLALHARVRLQQDRSWLAEHEFSEREQAASDLLGAIDDAWELHVRRYEAR